MNGKKLKQSPKSCEIKAHGRLHITLIGMNRQGYRVNGGIGFAVEEPFLTIRCTISDSFVVEDERQHRLTEDEIERLRNAIIEGNVLSKRGSIRIQISGSAPTHYGFGTSTAIRLACLEGAAIVHGRSESQTSLIQKSRRGGTSGIGINTYFAGGFVFDCGRRGDKEEITSSAQRERSKNNPPLVLLKAPMPRWKIGICVPHHITPMSEEQERLFFRQKCPIAREFVFETLYHGSYGVSASVLENDEAAFSKGINSIQMIGWKLAERRQYGRSLIELEEAIKSIGASCVGMTSLGPSLFFIGFKRDKISQLAREYPQCRWIVTEPCNTSRSIRYA